MKNSRILLISNGHGEDLIGARIAQSIIAADSSISLTALPIVGIGSAYQSCAIPLLITGKNLPSGGFVRNGLKYWWMDLRAGLLSLTLRQIKALRQIAEKVDLIVCVGDVYVLLLGGILIGKPLIFLPTAKSDYIAPHWPIEIALMRHFANQIFARDQLTAQSLSAHRVPACFVGNVMMDCLESTGADFRESINEWVIGILPGGRFEAYKNMEDITEAIVAFENLISSRSATPSRRFLTALSGGLSFLALAETLSARTWKQRPATEDDQARGIIGYLDFERANCPLSIIITQGRFPDVLKAADVIVGMAGTANEQAVGLGKPVLTFAGRGSQFTPKFVNIQKRLLGEAIRVAERNPEIIAKELLRLLTDKKFAASMVKERKERMGEPGGTARIVMEVLKMLKKPNVLP